MPTYEYLCKSCSHRFETWQRMVDEPLTVCPECGGHIHRVLYPAGVVFKGSGFYKTDHASDSGKHEEHGKHDGQSSTEVKSASDSKESSAAKPAESGSSSGSNGSTSGASESAASKSDAGSKVA